MAGNDPYHMYVYDIPYSERKALCRILDTNNAWEELGGECMKYDVLTLNRVGQAIQRSRSPTDELLTLWGTKNHTVHELFGHLANMQHHQAMTAIKKLVDPKYHCLINQGEENFSRIHGKPSSSVKRCLQNIAQEHHIPQLVEKDVRGSEFNIYSPKQPERSPTKIAEQPDMKISNLQHYQHSPPSPQPHSPYNLHTPLSPHSPHFQHSPHPQHSPQSPNSRNSPNLTPSPTSPHSPNPPHSPNLPHSPQSPIPGQIPNSPHSPRSPQLPVSPQSPNSPHSPRPPLSPNFQYSPNPPNSPQHDGARTLRKTSDQSNVTLGESPSINYPDLEKATGGWDRRKLLGKGGFGAVYKGVWKNTHVAIKRLEAQKGNDLEEVWKTYREQSLRELKYLNSCRHDNILPLYGYSIDGPYDCLVYQYMQNGSLEDRLQCKENTKPLTWSQRHSIATGAARGIQYLHTIGEKPLVHGDIKSANILLDPYLVPKIGDFGLAREGPMQQYTHIKVSRVHGTRPYLPDEFLRGKKFSTKVDTYSFGVVLFELATGLRAYDDAQPEKFLKRRIEIIQDDLLHEVMDVKAGPDDGISFMNMITLGKVCVSFRAKERPEMVAVLQKLDSILAAREIAAQVQAAKAQALAQAQAQALAQAQAHTQGQVHAQALAQAHTQAQALAQAQAQAQALAQAHGQAQVHAQAQVLVQAPVLAPAQAQAHPQALIQVKNAAQIQAPVQPLPSALAQGPVQPQAPSQPQALVPLHVQTSGQEALSDAETQNQPAFQMVLPKISIELAPESLDEPSPNPPSHPPTTAPQEEDGLPLISALGIIENSQDLPDDSEN